MNFHSEIDELIEDVRQLPMFTVFKPLNTSAIKFTQDILRSFCLPIMPPALIRLYSVCNGFSFFSGNVYCLTGNMGEDEEANKMDIFSMTMNYTGSIGIENEHRLVFGNIHDEVLYYDSNTQEWVSADESSLLPFDTYSSLEDLLRATLLI